jgi:hypothetical protein
MKPSIGRVVHYVSFGTPGGEFLPEHRAAIVTAVDPSNPEIVDLAVLNPTGMFFNRGVVHRDPSIGGGNPGGTWHWPERE